MVTSPLNHISLPSTAATFLQHVWWYWYIHLDILSSIIEILLTNLVSRSLMVDFILFSFFIFILLFFSFSFSFFYFQNNLGQGSSVTLSHQSPSNSVVTRLITGLRRMKQKELEQSDVMQHGYHMLASCITHGHLGQDAQQLARTMKSSI